MYINVCLLNDIRTQTESPNYVSTLVWQEQALEIARTNMADRVSLNLV